jgi:drug/metabolite transporter (DMT)-like permease
MATLRSRVDGHVMRHSRSYAVKVVLAFASIYVVWGSTYLAIRYTVATIPPLLAAGIRSLAAGAVLLVWAWVRGFRPKREHWLAGAAVGALFFLVSHGLLHWAEQKVASGLAALLIATEPMFILIFGWLAGQYRITRSSALGLGLGLLGVALLADFAHQESGLAGLAAVLLASLAWSAGVVVQPRLRLPADALARTALPLVCGAVMLLIAAALCGEFQRVQTSAISVSSVVGLAYLIVFGSVITLTAYMWLLQRCPPALVATHTYANPVVAVLLGWLVASEPLDARVAVACAAILLAIGLIHRGEQAKPAERPAAIIPEARAAGDLTASATMQFRADMPQGSD